MFDFGSEMYVWTGKHVPLDARRRVLKLATDRWQNGYDYSEFPVNPLCPLTRKFSELIHRAVQTIHYYTARYL